MTQTLTDVEVRVLGGLLFYGDGNAGRVFPKVRLWPAKSTVILARCAAQLQVAGYVKRFI